MLNEKKSTTKIVKTCIMIACAGFIISALMPRVHAETRPAAASSIENVSEMGVADAIVSIVKTTGIYAFFTDIIEKETPAGDKITVPGWQELLMIIVGFVVIWLGAVKKFEPLLLIPIGFGVVLVNIPGAGMGDPGVWNEAAHIFEHQGFLNVIYNAGVGNELFPLIIFIGIGAMTDFGPFIANPKTAFLGAAAQFGIVGTMFLIQLANLIPGIHFSLREACAVSIIGGADGPTTIYIASKLAPHLLATVAVAAYSYMALVPLIQPPIMRALTTKKERLIRMKQLREVSNKEKIIFPILIFVLCILLIPSAAPLIGALMFGNFLRTIGVVDRLSNTAQNELMNIVSMFLSLGVGSQMTPEKFLNPQSLVIIVMGLCAFAIATAAGVLTAKFMNLFLKEKINPLIGSAGVSAVPMAARVSNRVGNEEDPSNFILMHAMGPNVAGVIGTAAVAGIMIALFGG